MTDPEAILKKRKGVIDDDIQEVEDEYPPRGSSLDPSKKKKQLETAKPTGTTRREYDDNGMSIDSHPTVTTLPAQPATAKPSKAASKPFAKPSPNVTLTEVSEVSGAFIFTFVYAHKLALPSNIASRTMQTASTTKKTTSEKDQAATGGGSEDEIQEQVATDAGGDANQGVGGDSVGFYYKASATSVPFARYYQYYQKIMETFDSVKDKDFIAKLWRDYMFKLLTIDNEPY